jgi:purine catabolism regulator
MALAASYLGLAVPARSAGRVEMLASVLEMVAPLLALALARRRDRVGVERRLRAEALDALLAGTYSDDTQMAARAAQLGHDLALPHVGLAVELEDGGPRRELGLLPEKLQMEVPGAWMRARGDEVAALLPLSEGTAAAALAALAPRVAGRCVRVLGASGWSAGLGEPAFGPTDVRRSYSTARDAARLGRLLLGPGRVARAADLGIYRLLLRLREDRELEAFCRSTLGPLLAEPRSGDALLETLEVFFACNGNHSEAARRLHLHRNSLIYRLHRARELLGHDLEDPELRLALQLALRARHVLEL